MAPPFSGSAWSIFFLALLGLRSIGFSKRHVIISSLWGVLTVWNHVFGSGHRANLCLSYWAKRRPITVEALYKSYSQAAWEFVSLPNQSIFVLDMRRRIKPVGGVLWLVTRIPKIECHIRVYNSQKQGQFE